MNHEHLENRPESIARISFDPPVVESFLNPDRAAEAWPEEVATNEVFLEQLKERKELNESLDDVIKRLPRPDMPLKEAIAQGHITEQQVSRLYDSFNNLLESSPDYARFVLYCPFEFLPGKAGDYSTKELQQASGQFRRVYMKTWQSLLTVHDVRANFVDGDVLEVDQRHGDLPRVVKAAHLIPKLVENGLMEVKDVIALMEGSDDQTLKHSIADTLPVLADLGFITEKEIKLMEKSGDQLVVNMARIISLNLEAEEEQVEETSEPVTQQSVQKKLDDEFSRIEAAEYGDITEKRKKWLEKKKKQEAIVVQGEDIGLAIQENKFADEAVASLLTVEADAASQQALVEGIRKAIETVASTNPEKARTFYARYKATLLTLWKNNNIETKAALAKTFRRLFQLGIVDDGQLKELNIVIPKLAGPFSENLKSMEGEMRDIRDMVALIESKPELARLIYPAVLVYGSRLKGYGEPSADIDLGVFVRPGISFGERGKLRELLKETFSHEKIQGQIVEFWLEEKEGELKVHDFAEADASLGESYWAHIFFGAAWEGDKEAMRELRERLLVPYMRDTGEMAHGREARNLHLEEMERDTLQYRLMHKGYERFFPPAGSMHTPHADEIDGESMFWDSGYRQLATKLFSSRVFLPKIPASRK